MDFRATSLGSRFSRAFLLGIVWFSGAHLSDAFAQTPVPKKSSNIGVLTAFSGEVFLNGKAVTGGTVVALKDTIETKASGRCTLLLGRDAIVQLGALSKLEVTELEIEKRRTLLSLVHGTTRALVKTDRPGSTAPRREFKVRTRAATLGVRGTQIYIDSPMDVSLPQRFSTFEGEAVLELPVAVEVMGAAGAAPQKVQEIPIQAGQGVETFAGTQVSTPRPPEKVKIESYQPEQMKKWIEKSGGEITLPPSEQAAKNRQGPPPPSGPQPKESTQVASAFRGVGPGNGMMQGPPVFDPLTDSPTGSLRQGRKLNVTVEVRKQ